MLPFTEPLSYDFAAVCRERHSPDLDFKLGKVSNKQISILLKETLSLLYDNDLDEADLNVESRVAVYGCFYYVEGFRMAPIYMRKAPTPSGKFRSRRLPQVFTVRLNDG